MKLYSALLCTFVGRGETDQNPNGLAVNKQAFSVLKLSAEEKQTMLQFES
jgi:hypothetical protein